MPKQIYALCDYETLQKKQISLKDFIDICKDYNVIYIQYRDKISNLETQKQNLLLLASLTTIPIIINDRIDLLEFADGLHLGQEDLEILSHRLKLHDTQLVVKFLRKKYPNKIFGISTHNEKEILNANRLELDYIGLGSYRNTTTKEVSTVIGEKASYLAKISKYPVGIIGGVKLDDTIENISYYVIGSDLLKNWK